MAQTKLGAIRIVANALGLTAEELSQRWGNGQFRCRVCQEWMGADAFHKDLSRHNGLTSSCKQCRSNSGKNKYKPKPRLRFGPAPKTVPPQEKKTDEVKEKTPCQCGTDEIWGNHPLFPYYISNKGNIKNRNQRPIKTVSDKNGYQYFYPKRSHKLWVHRAVLETFVGPCPDNHETRHKNGNCWQNCLHNLQWGTKQENAEDKKMHNKKIYQKLSKLDRENILELLINYPARQVAITYNVSHTTINRIKKNGC